MTETNVNRGITVLVVTAIIWLVSTAAGLVASDGKQDTHIQTGHDADIAMKFDLKQHGERLAGLEANNAGITALLDTVVKNQDRILAKLDANR